MKECAGAFLVLVGVALVVFAIAGPMAYYYSEQDRICVQAGLVQKPYYKQIYHGMYWVKPDSKE